jgi:hypothetical protein
MLKYVNYKEKSKIFLSHSTRFIFPIYVMAKHCFIKNRKLKDYIKSNWTNKYGPLIINCFLEYNKLYGINNVVFFNNTFLNNNAKENLNTYWNKL